MLLVSTQDGLEDCARVAMCENLALVELERATYDTVVSQEVGGLLCDLFTELRSCHGAEGPSLVDESALVCCKVLLSDTAVP